MFRKRAAVLFQGIWRSVFGNPDWDHSFTFLLNGKQEHCDAGNWYSYDGLTDEQVENEVISLNISFLIDHR